MILQGTRFDTTVLFLHIVLGALVAASYSAPCSPQNSCRVEAVLRSGPVQRTGMNAAPCSVGSRIPGPYEHYVRMHTDPVSGKPHTLVCGAGFLQLSRLRPSQASRAATPPRAVYRRDQKNPFPPAKCGQLALVAAPSCPRPASPGTAGLELELRADPHPGQDRAGRKRPGLFPAGVQHQGSGRSGHSAVASGISGLLTPRPVPTPRAK